MFKKIIKILISNKYYFIVTPSLYTIGNSCEEIYLSLIKARKENRKVIFLIPFDCIYFYKRGIQCANIIKIRTRFNIHFDNYIFIIARIFLSVLIFLSTIIHFFLLKFFKIHIDSLRNFSLSPRIGISDIYNPYNGSFYEIKKNTLSYNWKKEFRNPLNLKRIYPRNFLENFLFKHFSIKKNQKYVCLHIRSHYTYDDEFEARERNASHQNYYKTIKYLISKGFIVIRMGDSKMPKLKKINGLIDYAHSKYNCQKNDEYLIANCDFYIGMGSGIRDMAFLFEKDMLIVNNSAWHYSFPKKNDVDIYKKVYDIKKNKNISIKNWIEKFPTANSYVHKIDSNLSFTENTPDEILQATINFIEKKKLSFSNMEMIRKSYLNSAHNFLNINKSKIELCNLYRFYLFVSIQEGSIDENFFKKYFI